MKKVHIVVIFVIAILISIFVVSGIDASTTADFAEAFQNPGTEFNVSGTLNRNRLVDYDPLTNPDKTSFYMLDDQGNERLVVLHKAKPQDFERSEKIVLTGAVKDDAFHATSILMKCPSKYNEQNQMEVEYDGEGYIQG